MSFHFSAQNDNISQVKLPITELVIHTTPTELIRSRIRTSTFTQLLSGLLQPTGRTVSCAFTRHPGGPSHVLKSTSHLEILCRNTQKCESKITQDLLGIEAFTSTQTRGGSCTQIKTCGTADRLGGCSCLLHLDVDGCSRPLILNQH